MAYLHRDDILGAEDRQTEEVPVPEWGGTVIVRALSGAERDKLEESVTQGTSGKMSLENFSARLAAMSIVDEHGKRVFSDKDIKALGQKSARALNRVQAAAQRLSRITNEDLQELTGNSEPDQSDD